jgi:hypothetical protein
LPQPIIFAFDDVRHRVVDVLLGDPGGLAELDRAEEDFVVEAGVLAVGAPLGDDVHAHPGGTRDVLGVGAHRDAGGERLYAEIWVMDWTTREEVPLFGNPRFHRVACH